MRINVKKICRIYADKEIFYRVYEKYQNKTLDISEGYKKKIEQIDKMYLYRLINKIEIDKDKNVYI